MFYNIPGFDPFWHSENTAHGSMIPSVDNAYDIGSASKYFKNAYITQIFAETLNTNTIYYNVNIQTTTYAVVSSDSIIIFNTTNSATCTLPSATASGRSLVLKNVNTGILTVDGDGSDTIDGATLQNVSQYESVQLIDYLANAWIIV